MSSYFPVWPLNTLVRLSDGEEVTICYNGLDGCGGCHGRHWFTEEQKRTDDLPMPDVLFRPDGHVPRGHKEGLLVVAYDLIPEVPWSTPEDGDFTAKAVWYPDERQASGLA